MGDSVYIHGCFCFPERYGYLDPEFVCFTAD